LESSVNQNFSAYGFLVLGGCGLSPVVGLGFCAGLGPKVAPKVALLGASRPAKPAAKLPGSIPAAGDARVYGRPI